MGRVVACDGGLIEVAGLRGAYEAARLRLLEAALPGWSAPSWRRRRRCSARPATSSASHQLGQLVRSADLPVVGS